MASLTSTGPGRPHRRAHTAPHTLLCGLAGLLLSACSTLSPPATNATGEPAWQSEPLTPAALRAGSPFYAGDSQHAGNPRHTDDPLDSGDPAALTAYALQHHPDLRQAQARWLAAQQQAPQAASLADPTLTLNQGLSDTDMQRLSLTQSFPLFGKRTLAREQADLIAQARAADLHALQRRVVRDVAERLAALTQAQARLAVYHDQAELLHQLSDVVLVRLQANQSLQADWLRLRSELDSLARDIANLQQQLPALRARLNLALGRPAQAALPALPALHELHRRSLLATSTQAATPSTPPAATDTAPPAFDTARHPRSVALALQYASQQRVLTLRERRDYPNLSLGIEYQRRANQPNQTGLMASINLPIWRGANQAAIVQANADLDALAQQWQQTQHELQAELADAHARHQQAQRNLRLARDTLQPRQEQTYALTQAGYLAGTVAFSDVINARREWLSVQLAIQDAQADGLTQQARLTALLEPVAYRDQDDQANHIDYPNSVHARSRTGGDHEQP